MKEQKAKSPLKATTRLIGLIINGIVLGVYFMALLSPYLSPRISQVPAFLNLGFLILLFLLMVLWLYYLIFRRWRYLILYTVVILISSGYILNTFPLNFGKGLRADRDLRVMTYNVIEFTQKDETTGEPLAAKFILEKGADIVALQEAGYYTRGKKNEELLKNFFGKQYPYIHSAKGKSQALLSKYPILYVDEIEYSSIGNGTHAYIIQLPNNRTLLAVNNHMESYVLKDKEIEKYKDYIRDFKPKEIPKQLLEVKRRLGPKLNQRAYAAEIVKKEVERLRLKYEPDYVIIMGDLNDTPMSYTYQQLKSGYQDAFAQTGLGMKVSYNEPFMPFRIDHLFYDGALKATGSEIPSKRKYSDHNPLIVDFQYVNK